MLASGFMRVSEMRIALDGTALSMTSGGLRRYTEELARALGDADVLCAQGPLWWSVRLPWKLRGYDVFHGTNFEVPYLPVCPTVLTLHDLSPWMNAGWHRDAGRVRSRTPALIGLGLATLIVTHTEAVRRQAIEVLRIQPERVVAVPCGARMGRVETTPGRPYFLFVGTVEPRKNVPALIEAWRPLRERVDLVIAGRKRADAPEILSEPGLRVEGEVSETRLAELYSGASALVYPSLYEGFGLPVIEAMQCGTPVIASRDAALMEVSGGVALHVDPSGLTGAMRNVLAGQVPDRDTLLRRGREFTWERTARLTREVYGEAIARARRLS